MYGVLCPQLLAMTRKDLDIIVVGAGIGGKGHGFSFSNSNSILPRPTPYIGLAAAIALALKGHAMTVFEVATQIQEIGARIQITPLTLLLLIRWGLGPQFEGFGCQPKLTDIPNYPQQKRLDVEYPRLKTLPDILCRIATDAS